MSAQLKLASDIPAPRDASGDVNGTIGDHIFTTQIGKWSYHNGIVNLFLLDKHDDGSVAEEVFIQFPSDVELNKELTLLPQKAPQAWVTFNANKPPEIVQCTQATLFIETLEISPFIVKGHLNGATDDTDHSVNIDFYLKQNT